MAAAQWDDLVVVARVARAHGLRGDVVLDAVTDFPEERFAPGGGVLIQVDGSVRALTIRTARFHRGRPIVGFEGVDSIDQAEAFAGCELRIAPGDLIELPPDMFYHHDLVGCRVETADGAEVGTVAKVEGEGATSRLVVSGPAGEQLVPMVDEICREIDTTARRIVIAAPEGLLGLNEVRGPKRVWRGRRW